MNSETVNYTERHVPTVRPGQRMWIESRRPLGNGGNIRRCDLHESELSWGVSSYSEGTLSSESKHHVLHNHRLELEEGLVCCAGLVAVVVMEICTSTTCHALLMASLEQHATCPLSQHIGCFIRRNKLHWANWLIKWLGCCFNEQIFLQYVIHWSVAVWCNVTGSKKWSFDNMGCEWQAKSAFSDPAFRIFLM